MSEPRPRRATIRISLAAFGAGAVIAGTATILNQPGGQPAGLEVPTVAGFNADGNNRARQGGGAADATALSGAASTPGSTSSSAATSSSSPSSSSPSAPSTPGSTPSESSSQPAPPQATEQPPQTTKQQQAGSPDPAQAAEVVRLVNQFRDDMGCDPLKVDSRLTTAAQKHSTDMAQNNFFNHTSAAGTFDQRIRAEGYPTPAAENIAKGQTSAQEVMRSWMQSDGHRRNILNCRYSTIGVAVDKQGWLWTQDFGF